MPARPGHHAEGHRTLQRRLDARLKLSLRHPRHKRQLQRAYRDAARRQIEGLVRRVAAFCYVAEEA